MTEFYNNSFNSSQQNFRKPGLVSQAIHDRTIQNLDAARDQIKRLEENNVMLQAKNKALLENQDKLIRKIQEYNMKQSETEEDSNAETETKTEPEISIIEQA